MTMLICVIVICLQSKKQVLGLTKKAASLRKKKSELQQENLILRNRLAELIGKSSRPWKSISCLLHCFNLKKSIGVGRSEQFFFYKLKKNK